MLIALQTVGANVFSWRYDHEEKRSRFIVCGVRSRVGGVSGPGCISLLLRRSRVSGEPWLSNPAAIPARREITASNSGKGAA